MSKKSLCDVLRGVNLKPAKKLGALWEGPESDGPQGGITQSMMSGLLTCRYRAKLMLVDGLSSAEGFNKNLEYGNIWHVCEEALAAKKDWNGPLLTYTQKLARKYPLQQQEAVKWYEVCRRQFPVYVDYWKKHPDVKDRTPLFQEKAFQIPYELPSGRVVYLRGKFDSVDLIGKGRDIGVYLQENKTKGDIDVETLQKNLTFDNQTMFYLVALSEYPDVQVQEHKLKGVRYNVIRRPLSGGKGSIRPHAEKRTKNTYTPAETDQHYYDRLLNDYLKPDPAYWFARWTVEITKTDIERYKTEFLHPFLENVCWWYDLVTGKSVDVSKFDLNCLNFRLPFGTYNPVTEGAETDVDNYLRTGSTVGLSRSQTLFPELESDEDD